MYASVLRRTAAAAVANGDPTAACRLVALAHGKHLNVPIARCLTGMHITGT